MKKNKLSQQPIFPSLYGWLRRRRFLLSLASLLVLVGLVSKVLSKPQNSTLPLQFHLQLPLFTTLEVENLAVVGDPQTGQWSLILPEDTIFPLHLKAIGPFGEELSQFVNSTQELQDYPFPQGIEPQALSNPPTLSVLPQLCPRLIPTAKQRDFQEEEEPQFTYLAEKDRMNHRPTFQLLDSDPNTGKQDLTISEMDGLNVLLVKQVRMSHDYEDSNHIEYQGWDETGKEKIITEDNRGFYANFQYAVVPYSSSLEDADPQTLLHLGQGSLEKIGKAALNPEMRTRSFIPGPYLSKKEYFYELCEWGDTAFHAKKQALNYQNLALWDWDYPVEEKDKVLLIIWESDEEHLDRHFKDLPKNYLIDDLIGVFVIDYKQSLEPLTLVNAKGDFEITVQTGDFRIK